jgi:phage regulator Rha-like protein
MSSIMFVHKSQCMSIKSETSYAPHRQQAKWFSDQHKKLIEEIKDLESRISQLSQNGKKELGQHTMTLKGQNKMIEEQGEGTSKYLEIGIHQDNDKALIKAKADKISEEWYKRLFGEPEEVRGKDREP